MKANESEIEIMYFIDVDGTQLNASEVNQGPIRSKVPFSRMKTGKFRKLFNRHDFVFNRFWTSIR